MIRLGASPRAATGVKTKRSFAPSLPPRPPTRPPPPPVFIRPLLCLTSSPAVHKHTTHPAALSSAPSAPALYLRLSCLEPFPSLSLSLPLLLPVRPPARRSSAKAANIRRLCLIFCAPHKGSDSPTFYCFLSFSLGGVYCGGVLEKMMYKTWCLR